MFPMTTLQMAQDRAAELHQSAARSRGARAVALAARQQDVLARRKLRAFPPDRPIVTAKPVRPRVAAPQPAAARTAIPATQVSPASTGAAAAADAGGAPVAVLTPCTAC